MQQVHNQLWGYNYGAKENLMRVKQTLKLVLSSSVIISTIAFILFQTIPDKLISILVVEMKIIWNLHVSHLELI